MGSTFGSLDKNATNDVDANGNVVATGTPGANTVADPNQGLSAGQMFTRKALSGAVQGAGNAMQQQGGMKPGARPMQPQQSAPQPAQPNFLQQSQNQGAQSTQPVVPPQNTGMTAPVGINGNKSPFAKGPNPSLFYGAPGGF